MRTLDKTKNSLYEAYPRLLTKKPLILAFRSQPEYPFTHKDSGEDCLWCMAGGSLEFRLLLNHAPLLSKQLTSINYR